ncbi:MAG: hypothetical protein QHI48_00535 [Bacteroidota bacterium]|nr:hypothetical protein [Bacteroidota bacterium]
MAVLMSLVLSSCERLELPSSVPDEIPPLPPAGLIVESSHDGYVFIGWLKNTERDLRGYIVYRSEGIPPTPPYLVVDTVTRNFYIDGGLSYDTLYSYFVVALDASGNVSMPSDTVTVRSPNEEDPETPLSFQVHGKNQEGQVFMRLEWIPTNDFDLAGYVVYRGDGPEVLPSQRFSIAFTERAMYDDTAVSADGRRWYYTVTAVDRGGRYGQASPVRSDLVTLPPEILEPADGAQVTGYPLFVWKGVRGALSYEVTVSREPSSGVIWTGSVTDSGEQVVHLQYTGPVLNRGRAYYWRISTFTQQDRIANAVTRAFIFQIM